MDLFSYPSQTVSVSLEPDSLLFGHPWTIPAADVDVTR